MFRGPARDMMQVGKIGLEADHRDVRHEGDMSEESRRNYDVFISYSSKERSPAPPPPPTPPPPFFFGLLSTNR